MKLTATSDPAGQSACEKKPRLGFLGVGWIGFQRMASIAESGFAEVVAVADPSAEFLEKAREKFPRVQTLATIEELLELELDGVVIATPSAFHAEQSIRALEQGFAVFCQKPLGRNAAEVSQVVAAAKKANRLLGVDLSYRYTQALLTIRTLLQSGELGSIFAVDLTFHNAYGPQREWFYNPEESGGGCVMDLGIHLVDAALWLLASRVVDVSSRLFYRGQSIRGREHVCEDYATALLSLESGAAVNLACSWHLQAGQDAVIEAAFYGTYGGVRLSNVSGSFTDFVVDRFRGTTSERVCEGADPWGGRAAVEWARLLAAGAGYDPAVEQIITVTEALDSIYNHAAF